MMKPLPKKGGAWTTFFNFNLLLLEFFSEKNDPSQCDAAAAGVKNQLKGKLNFGEPNSQKEERKREECVRILDCSLHEDCRYKYDPAIPPYGRGCTAYYWALF